MAQDKIFQSAVVQENTLISLPSPIENPNAPAHESDEDDGPSSLAPNQLTAEQIPTSISPAKNEDFIKQCIRTQVMTFKNPLRKLVWKQLYLRMEAVAGSTTDQFNAISLAEATAGFYQDTIQTCFGTKELPPEDTGLPNCVDVQHMNSYYLNKTGKGSIIRILTCFAYNHPDLQYSPMLYPIASIIRHFLTEEDTYGFLAIMASRRSKYLFTSKMQFEVASVTAYELSKNFCKKHIAVLEEKGSHEEVLGLFGDWLWWIFDYMPFPHVVRILDLYFVEGCKVFYRVGFALLRYFVKYIKKSNEIISSRGIKGAFINFCKEITVSPDNLIKKGLKIRGFSKTNIEKTYLRAEVNIKSRGILNNSGPEPRAAGGPVRSVSNDRLPSSESVAKITAISTSLTYKEGMLTPQPRVKAMAVVPIHHLNSDFLSKNDLITIWHWLPERMTMANPELIYSSNEHGISMTTFYQRTEQYEPTILVIKTTKSEIFGAYCSTSWAVRNLKDDQGRRQHYFGTGETFLFTFAIDEKPVRYIWVNADKTEDEIVGTKAEQHQRELFMCGRPDMISIGGGNGNGLFLDPSLTQGKTERCATFDNQPLCQSGDFTISAIEVYGLFKLDCSKNW